MHSNQHAFALDQRALAPDGRALAPDQRAKLWLMSRHQFVQCEYGDGTAVALVMAVTDNQLPSSTYKKPVGAM